MRVLILGGPFAGDVRVPDNARSIVFAPIASPYISTIELPIEPPLTEGLAGYGGVVTWTEEAQRAYEWVFDRVPPQLSHRFRRAAARPAPHQRPDPAMEAWLDAMEDEYEDEPLSLLLSDDKAQGKTIDEIVPDLIEEIDAVLAQHREET